MGDALSNGVAFEFLKTEIVDVATSEERAEARLAVADQTAQAHGQVLPLAGSPGHSLGQQT